jgi:hypothetical protein
VTDIEIYRVSDDIGEARNLAEQEPEQLMRLSKLIKSAYGELVADSLAWGE